MSYPGSSKRSKSGMASAGGKKRRKGSRQSGFEQTRVVAEIVPASYSTGRTRMYAPTLQQVVQTQATFNRLKEHKTFDSVAAGPVAIANCFSNAGAVAGTPFAPVASTSAWCLNQVPLGNSSITRVGRRFANTAIAIRAKITAGVTGTIALAGLVLVWDRNPNQGAAIPGFTSVFTTQDPVSLTNKDGAPRFKILRRWIFEVTGNKTAGQITTEGSHYIDEFVKMKNKVTILTAADTTGLITDMQEGSLLLYAMGDMGADTTAPSLTIQTRLYFGDN